MLLERWPELSHHFGIQTWHVRDGLLSPPEMLQYLEVLDVLAEKGVW